MYNLMNGKKGIVMGVINKYSIAWSIASALSDAGATLAFSYPNEKIKGKLAPLAESLNSSLLLECDVTKSETIENTFKSIEKEWGTLDFIVHSIAFSDKEELKGKYLDTSLNNFLNSMHISCYSFTEIMKHATPLMKNGGSAITLTFQGSTRVLPHYNVMGVAKAALEASVKYIAADIGDLGVRVNAISAGPIKTLAASGISGFNYILKWNEQNAPLFRNVSQEEVGKSALYLLSDLSSGVTGEIHHVDAGYNIIGMKRVTKEDLE